MIRAALLLPLVGIMAAFSSSSSYELQSYSVGAGGTNNTSSSSYGVQGNVGENAGSVTSSTSYQANSGQVQAEQADVPPAPTLSNGGGTYYNQLGVIVSTGGNPSDATFAIAVSPNNFTNTYYVQSDGSLGSTQYFQTYTGWGGASGTYIVGLSSSTTYEVKVSAQTGKFTQSAYGPYATASTTAPSLTFSLSPNSQSIGSLLPGQVVTSPSTLNFNLTSNADFGASIYVAGQYGGLYSSYSGNTIPAYSGDLSSVTHGFGIQDVSASSPLTSVSPYNGTTTNVGGEATSTYASLFSSAQPISSGSASVQFEAKSASSDMAGNDYTEVLTFIAAASY